VQDVAVVRHAHGGVLHANPKDAAPARFAAIFATITKENLIHGSDSPESVEREIAIFFPHLA